MPHDTRTVYSTEHFGDAQTVRSLLAAEGVSAILFRDPFESARSAGATDVHIQVAAADEAAARRVIGRLERSRLGPGADGTVIDAWPRCPECAAPRMTCCPVCQTAGHDFPQADPEFSVLPEPGAAEEPLACGCGSCSGGGPDGSATPAGEISAALPDDATEPDGPVMLTCTTCDEPFVPRYLRRCEWCGHTFPDGIEFELPGDPAEPLNARVVFVFFSLAAAVLAVLAWLAYVL
ncbi:MAG: hypothetical protein RBS80_19005 [Thermoguttaceae bacterium]|jgi:hypothetical protein|nr:hypothetical protein [Thermoguttaceae bacterium]